MTYTIQYSPTNYADGRVTYRARLMLGDTVPVLISDAGHKTERDALIGLAFKYITQILDDPEHFTLLSRLPTELHDTVEDATHAFAKVTQNKIRSRIRRREKQSLKERTV